MSCWEQQQGDDMTRPTYDELVQTIKDCVFSLRTFRDVPQSEQQWTSIDDDVIEQAFNVIDRAQA
jgi:hypothetical protein